jgi:hypothetical protein
VPRVWIISSIAIILVLLVWVGRFEIGRHSLNKSLPSANSISQWATCTNNVGGYSFKYPSNWRVFESGIGSFEETDCESAPADFFITPNPLTTTINGQVNFYYLFDTGSQPPPQSLDDFFAKYPDILKVNKLLMTGSLGGEKAVWLMEPKGGIIDIYCWHNFHILRISTDTVDESELHNIVNTFSFDKQAV